MAESIDNLFNCFNEVAEDDIEKTKEKSDSIAERLVRTFYNLEKARHTLTASL